jgi:hypothetical protein
MREDTNITAHASAAHATVVADCLVIWASLSLRDRTVIPPGVTVNAVQPAAAEPDLERVL